MCMFSVCLIDVLQDPLVCLIQRFRQFVKNPSYTRRKTVPECFELTVYPTKPASSYERVSNHTARYPYIPSARSDSVSMTSLLSSSRHLRIFVSEYTTELTYSMMSFLCPVSSWRETRRDVKGSRASIMSISGRLVTQMWRFGRRRSTRSLTRSRIRSREDGMPELFGHSSSASTMR